MRMNNQYEYVEKPLTPNIARELIQELFAGQTVQKQEIIRIVDETHRERGGLPSRARFHHPVTLALSNMRREGWASNPSPGNWSIPASTQDDDSVDFKPDNLDSESLALKRSSVLVKDRSISTIIQFISI